MSQSAIYNTSLRGGIFLSENNLNILINHIVTKHFLCKVMESVTVIIAASVWISPGDCSIQGHSNYQSLLNNPPSDAGLALPLAGATGSSLLLIDQLHRLTGSAVCYLQCAGTQCGLQLIDCAPPFIIDQHRWTARQPARYQRAVDAR